jgi:L-malate glycosyltransferase
MRICFITTMAGAPWGGSEYLWSAAAQAALERGDRLLVVVFEHSLSVAAVAALASAGAEVVVRPSTISAGPLPFLRRVLNRLGAKRRPEWLRRVEGFAPEVIFASHGNTYEALSDPWVERWLLESHVPRLHLSTLNSLFHHLGLADRVRAQALFKRAQGVLFVARENLESAERQLASPLPRRRVVRTPVSLALWDAPLPWPAGGLRLASVARLEVRYKGQDLLLQALASPVWRERDWRLDIVGNGPDLDYINSLAIHYQLRERVRFVPHVPDVTTIWRENQVLVMPSRAEGTPIAMIEAMLCGRPAVMTDVGGAAEWVEEGRSGFIADGITARSIGAALDRLWASRDRLEEMGCNARKRALALHDPDPAGSLLALLDDAARSAGVQS